MKIKAILFLLLLLVCIPASQAQIDARMHLNLPELDGYMTLKCDFHMHTVFSDGLVWPPVRVEEAWREGLDAISITDHIEYLPHKEDIKVNHNRSYELALQRARDLGIILIKGAEITRDMPPGHLNTIFIVDANPLDDKSWKKALQTAKDQGGFIFFNHPNFPHPQRIAEWFPQHQKLYEKGLINGIEVVNTRTYYPKAHQWCIEKELAMIASSDIHAPIGMDYDIYHGDHRPMTLVFAMKRSQHGILEALQQKRTVVYHADKLIGTKEWLQPLFENSIDIHAENLKIVGRNRAYIQISNRTDIPFHLTLQHKIDNISCPKEIELAANRTTAISIRPTEDDLSGKELLRLPYSVDNVWIKPEQPLSFELQIEAEFFPVPK